MSVTSDLLAFKLLKRCNLCFFFALFLCVIFDFFAQLQAQLIQHKSQRQEHHVVGMVPLWSLINCQRNLPKVCTSNTTFSHSTKTDVASLLCLGDQKSWTSYCIVKQAPRAICLHHFTPEISHHITSQTSQGPKFVRQYAPAFSQFLTQKVGSKFDPAIKFTMRFEVRQVCCINFTIRLEVFYVCVCVHQVGLEIAVKSEKNCKVRGACPPTIRFEVGL
jgi:hypothetical protein